MSRRKASIFISAIAALSAWVVIPGTALDRFMFSLTANVLTRSDHFVSGSGTLGKPFTIHKIRDIPTDLADKLPADIVVTQDPQNVFQASPPSPVDFAIILKNLRRMGRDSIAIGMPLSWSDPDILSLTALDQQLDAFRSAITSAPLARNPVPTPIPTAFRRASIPLLSIIGDTSMMPRVDRMPIPDVMLGNSNSLAGFTTLESEEPTALPYLLARWDDRAVLSFHLLTALQHFGIDPHSISIRLGEWISLGPAGPYIPIDAFGRLTVRPPALDSESIPAESLIDAPEDFLTNYLRDPVVIRNTLTALDPTAAAYSVALVPTVAMLTDPDGTVTSQRFQRLPWYSELLLIASLISVLVGLKNFPSLAGKIPLVIISVAVFLLHFLVALTFNIWAPTFPLLACVLAAIPLSAGAPRSVPAPPTSRTSSKKRKSSATLPMLYWEKYNQESCNKNRLKTMRAHGKGEREKDSTNKRDEVS